MTVGTHTCPVCDYDGLTEAPLNWSICPCCFTEFGASDLTWTHAELREDWIARGARWADPDMPPPPGWDAAAR